MDIGAWDVEMGPVHVRWPQIELFEVAPALFDLGQRLVAPGDFASVPCIRRRISVMPS